MPANLVQLSTKQGRLFNQAHQPPDKDGLISTIDALSCVKQCRFNKEGTQLLVITQSSIFCLQLQQNRYQLISTQPVLDAFFLHSQIVYIESREITLQKCTVKSNLHHTLKIIQADCNNTLLVTLSQDTVCIWSSQLLKLQAINSKCKRFKSCVIQEQLFILEDTLGCYSLQGVLLYNLQGVDQFHCYQESLLTLQSSKLSFGGQEYLVHEAVQIQCCKIGFCVLDQESFRLVSGDGVIETQVSGVFDRFQIADTCVALVTGSKIKLYLMKQLRLGRMDLFRVDSNLEEIKETPIKIKTLDETTMSTKSVKSQSVIPPVLSKQGTYPPESRFRIWKALLSHYPLPSSPMTILAPLKVLQMPPQLQSHLTYVLKTNYPHDNYHSRSYPLEQWLQLVDHIITNPPSWYAQFCQIHNPKNSLTELLLLAYQDDQVIDCQFAKVTTVKTSNYKDQIEWYENQVKDIYEQQEVARIALERNQLMRERQLQELVQRKEAFKQSDTSELIRLITGAQQQTNKVLIKEQLNQL